MKNIPVEELSPESFRKFGVYQSLVDNEAIAAASINGAGGFAPDLIYMHFSPAALPTISVATVKKQDKRVIRFLEYHRNTCEGMLPLDDDIVIYVGTLYRRELSTENLRAFRIPKGTFVRLNSYIIHGTQFCSKPEAHILIMLTERTFGNDIVFKMLSEEEQVEVIG
ncbi:MAG: hypothetical protein ACOX17_08765 [Christensenellales bacterium]